VATYLTPGVYFENADAVVPAITALRTDIAGFVGIAERGVLHNAVPVESWRQFQATFGNFIGTGYLAYSVKAFFENGGRKCYVVRVADSDVAARACLDLLDSNPITANKACAWRVEASSPGVWGNQLAVQVRTTHGAQTRTVVGLDAFDRSASRVISVAHFEPGTLVRLVQPGAALVSYLRTVKEVDGEWQRLVWSEPLDQAFALDVPAFIESIEYTLTIYWLGRVAAIYEGLSVVPEHPRFAPNIVVESPLQPSDSRADILPPPPPLVVVSQVRPPVDPKDLLEDTPEPSLLTGGLDGLETLTVRDFIGEAEDALETDEQKALKRRGLRALERIDEVSLVAIPDIHIQPVLPPRIEPLPPPVRDPCVEGPPEPSAPNVPPVFPEMPPVFSEQEIFQVQAAMVEHCEELRDRFALLDPPFLAARNDQLGAGAIIAWRSRFESKYAALHYPWLRVVDPLRLRGAVVRDLPPSGHVAGLFAQTDLTIGVYKAPANAELEWAEDTTAIVTDSLQADLNPRGINAIRVFSGRGICVYGARTVSSDPDWRYINVRRLIMMIEEALDLATQWVVFEPNDFYTRGKVMLAITSFMETLWRSGALTGTHPDQAFFVKCDENNNPPSEREQGRMHVEVGVAPSVPYEFVVLRIGRTTEDLAITEYSKRAM
jgi:phage tail sheath protein FI